MRRLPYSVSTMKIRNMLESYLQRRDIKGEVIVHRHWEIESTCPNCGKINKHNIPEGEHVVRVHCDHCTHGYDYTHIVREHEEVIDEN